MIECRLLHPLTSPVVERGRKRGVAWTREGRHFQRRWNCTPDYRFWACLPSSGIHQSSNWWIPHEHITHWPSFVECVIFIVPLGSVQWITSYDSTEGITEELSCVLLDYHEMRMRPRDWTKVHFKEVWRKQSAWSFHFKGANPEAAVAANRERRVTPVVGESRGREG